MKKLFKFLWKWLVILVLTYTFISVVSSFIPPKYFWGLFFLSYSAPFMIGANALLLFLYLFIKKRFWLIAISTALSIYGAANNWSWSSSKDDDTASYSLMTYNVRLFDYYNWLDGKSWDNWKARTDDGATLDSLYQTIGEIDADFLCIQEYFNQSSGEYNSTKHLRSIGYKYEHTGYSVQGRENQYGIATFSKYPIINKKDKFFKGKLHPNNGIIITDVKTNKDTIRIINVHLESFRLAKEDYKYLNELRELNDSTLDKIEAKPTRALISKIKHAFVRRSDQLEYLLSEIENSPHSVILCGDFNELPNSYLYRTLSDKLSDGFHEVGKGFGTSLVSDLPALRIDYVFHSSNIKAVSHQVVDRILSDHYPLLFKFKSSPRNIN